jgi:hypothetical protein
MEACYPIRADLFPELVESEWYFVTMFFAEPTIDSAPGGFAAGIGSEK